MQGVYQSFWNLPIYLNALQTAECWQCLQQDVRRSNEVRRPRVLDILPGQYPDV